MSASPAPTTTIEALAETLGPELGAARAEDAVRRAAESLALRPPFSVSDAERVIERLVAMGGPSASAARLARARGSFASPGVRGSLPSVPVVILVTRSDLVDLLAPSLGLDASESLVAKFGDRLGFPAVGEKDGALRLLETMTTEPGVVGVAARFAKVKLILK